MKKMVLAVLSLVSLFTMGFYADNQINQAKWKFTLVDVPNTYEEVWVFENTAYDLSQTPDNSYRMEVTANGVTNTVYVSKSVYDYYKAYPKKLAKSEYASPDAGYLIVQGYVPNIESPQKKDVLIGQTVTYSTVPMKYTYPGQTTPKTSTTKAPAHPDMGAGYKWIPYNEAPASIQKQVVDKNGESIYQVLNPSYPPMMLEVYTEHGWSLPPQYVIVYD